MGYRTDAEIQILQSRANVKILFARTQFAIQHSYTLGYSNCIIRFRVYNLSFAVPALIQVNIATKLFPHDLSFAII